MKNYVLNYALIILGLLLLIPQGIGYRFSMGMVDVPRITMMLTVAIGGVFYLRHWISARRMVFPSGSKFIVLLMALISLSAFTSSNPSASSLLAIQHLTMWFLFPLAFLLLVKDDHDVANLNNGLMVIFIIIMMMVFVEVATQRYIIPPEWRTGFYGFEGYEWFSERVLRRGGLLLPQGPFTWNHTLSGLGCIGVGIALYAMDRYKTAGLIFAYVFFMMIAVAGVRAGAAGCLIAIVLYSIWFRNPMIIIHFVGGILAVEIIYLAVFGQHIPILFTGDISTSWSQEVEVNHETFKRFQDTSSTTLADIIKHFGTIGVKIAGFALNLVNLGDWWANGYGYASFQRPSKIASSAIQYNDPGVVQLIFLESGLLAGGLFVFILVRAVLIGLKYDSMKYYSVGITAWSIFALSSWDIWPVIFAILFVLLIHQHHHQHKHELQQST